MEELPWCSVEVDSATRRVSTIWRGPFDIAAISQSCRRRTQLGGHTFPQFIDATQAQVARLPKDLREIPLQVSRLAAQSEKHGLAGPTAIVVHGMVDFGICRMIAAYFHNAGQIVAFYDPGRAQAWLDASANSPATDRTPPDGAHSLT